MSRKNFVTFVYFVVDFELQKESDEKTGCTRSCPIRYGRGDYRQ